MNTIFTSKVIMFEECLQFKDAIILCYGRQKTMALQQRNAKSSSVGCCWSNHILLKPYCINMCHESIKGPLVIFKHFDNNYCTYYMWTWKQHYCHFLVGIKFLILMRVKSLFCIEICDWRLLRLSNLFCKFSNFWWRANS